MPLAVGVWGSALLPGYSYLYEGRDYFYCETTGEGWKFGDLPSVYQDVPANIYAIDENQQYWPDEGVLWSLVAALMCLISIPVYLLIRRFRKKLPASRSTIASSRQGEISTAGYLRIGSQDPNINKVEASKGSQ